MTSVVLVDSSQRVAVSLILVLRAIAFRWHGADSQGARGNHQSRPLPDEADGKPWRNEIDFRMRMAIARWVWSASQ